MGFISLFIFYMTTNALDTQARSSQDSVSTLRKDLATIRDPAERKCVIDRAIAIEKDKHHDLIADIRNAYDPNFSDAQKGALEDLLREVTAVFNDTERQCKQAQTGVVMDAGQHIVALATKVSADNDPKNITLTPGAQPGLTTLYAAGAEDLTSKKAIKKPASARTTSEAFEATRSLYEGMKYNNLDINSALSVLKDHFKDGKISPDLRTFLTNLRNFNRSSLLTPEQKRSADNEATFVIMRDLKKMGYIKGASPYFEKEMQDLSSFMEDHLGSEKLQKNLSVDIAKSIEIKKLDLGDVDSILQCIADMGGIDQGQKSDGVLRGMNSKQYSGWMSRIFTSGEWAQNQIVGELQMYQILKDRIGGDVLKLKQILSETTGVHPTELGTVFAPGNTERFQEIITLYQQVAMNRIAQVKDPRAIAYTNAEFQAQVVSQAKDSVKQFDVFQQMLQEQLKKNPKFVEARSKKEQELVKTHGATNEQAKSILSTWQTTFFSQPQIYAGVNFAALDTTTINRVVDTAGKTLSESQSQTRTVEGKLYLVLSMNLASLEARTSENVGVRGSIGASAVTGIDGVALLLGTNAGVTYTMSDKNPPLQASEGNFVVGMGGGISFDILK